MFSIIETKQKGEDAHSSRLPRKPLRVIIVFTPERELDIELFDDAITASHSTI